MPTGPDARVKITAEYAKLVGKDAYFWAWPLVNMYNRRLHFAPVKEMTYVGPLMEPPLNRLIMLTDYGDPAERAVACPNQDVVYGLGALALDVSPVVIQVPDFGDRFWVYQAWTCGPTASPSSARCTARCRVSTCWWGPTGRARCRGASRESSDLPRTAASSRHACSRTTRRRTSARSRRFSPAS